MVETDAPVLVERRAQLLLIGLNRPTKRNAADFATLQALSAAYGVLERDDEVRAAVVYGVGDHFTAGLDLADVGPHIADGRLEFVPDGGLDPWQMQGEPRTKPVVLAVQGTCLTLGIELALAADVVIAADSTRFAQLEVSRGILPFGGATIRFPQVAGWGNAMRWMLTGETFDAAEALRMGVVQQVVPHGQQLEAAIAVAERIAAQAPLAVRAVIRNARLAAEHGESAAKSALFGELAAVAASEDAGIGIRSFVNRETALFVGR